MNSWVYEGFDKTYNSLGIEFDKNYYESNTYLKGKKIVEQGISNGIFYTKKDNSRHPIKMNNYNSFRSYFSSFAVL